MLTYLHSRFLDPENLSTEPNHQVRDMGYCWARAIRISRTHVLS